MRQTIFTSSAFLDKYGSNAIKIGAKMAFSLWLNEKFGFDSKLAGDFGLEISTSEQFFKESKINVLNVLGGFYDFSGDLYSWSISLSTYPGLIKQVKLNFLMNERYIMFFFFNFI